MKKMQSMRSTAIAVMAATAAVTAAFIIGQKQAEKYRKMREERLQSLKDSATESANEANSLTEEAANVTRLYAVYQEAQQAVKDGTGTKEEYRTATDNLTSALGIEKDAVDNLKKSYEELVKEQQAAADEAINVARQRAIMAWTEQIGQNSAEKVVPEWMETFMNASSVFTPITNSMFGGAMGSMLKEDYYKSERCHKGICQCNKRTARRYL